MPELQAVLDEATFNAIEDSSLKDFYTQNTETKQYFLNVKGADEIAFNLKSEVERLKSHSSKLLGEKKEIQDKYKAYESLGKSADELKIALESNRPEEINKLIEKYEAEKNSLKSSFDEALANEKTARERYQQQLLGKELESAINKAVLAFDLDPETAPANLKEFLRVVEDENGNVAVQVYENGQPALVAGQPKTIEQLLKGFIEKKEKLKMFLAPNGGGTNSSNRQTSQSGTKTLKRADWETRSARGENFTDFFANGGQIID